MHKLPQHGKSRFKQEEDDCNNFRSRRWSSRHAYVSLAANPVAVAVIPAVLAFAACPAMCAAMGGAMWFSRRFSKRKNQTQVQQSVVNSKEEVALAKTESIDNNQQHVTYPQSRRKDKTVAQDISAISD